jgi:hypothetical protein
VGGTPPPSPSTRTRRSRGARHRWLTVVLGTRDTKVPVILVRGGEAKSCVHSNTWLQGGYHARETGLALEADV